MRGIQTGCVAALLAIGSIVGVDATAGELTIEVHRVDADGVGERIGTIEATANDHGVVLTPDLQQLTPGLHGFHVHQHASCEPGDEAGQDKAALAAGGHYDPEDTDRHRGPWGDGHAGDLPALHVAADGTATHPVLAPRLELGDLRGRALMLHGGGDNYADEPQADGGGGARVACGVAGS